ncbi:ankyrin repeat-containing protein P16F5.05c-like, partial [Phalaenopsis equestris]|uniref:ankyrin repeat-containing protein P16F5.05c-like n=1 Tax=Phalaenopsis equestris TaxID=78828 RepID=UPI0009E34E47
ASCLFQWRLILNRTFSYWKNIFHLQAFTKYDAFFLLSSPAALHMAAANGHVDIVEYLIRNGVDVNTSNTEKNTPLHWACLNGKKEVVRALILAGANVSLLNSYERTPMDEAVARGEMDVVDAINAVVAQAELQGVGVF